MFISLGYFFRVLLFIRSSDACIAQPQKNDIKAKVNKTKIHFTKALHVAPLCKYTNTVSRALSYAYYKNSL